MSQDVAASIKARLLNQAKRLGEEFQLFLVRYGHERFLYRLGASDYRERIVLKGAGLLAVWMPDPFRATRDVDVLASGPSDEAAVRAAMTAICAVPCPEDGLVFDLDGLSVEPIRAEQMYAGQRAVVIARLGRTRIRLQVDFGFGDVLSVAAEESELTPLVDRVPVPKVRTYPRVATVAEKFEAMVQLGRRNSRMKDFHDIWALSDAFAFDGPSLCGAVSACFSRRGTPWTPVVPDVLSDAFSADPDVQARWRAYIGRGQFRVAPPASVGDVCDRIRAFLGPVRESILREAAFDRQWPPGGPWR